MKLVVFGATGGVGSQIVAQGAAAGHEVTAVTRREVSIPGSVRVAVGDIEDPTFVSDVIAGHDAVASALGLRRAKETSLRGPLASPPDLTSRVSGHIVAGMHTHGVHRVAAVSAAGVGNSRPGLNPFMRALIRFTNVGAFYADLERMEPVYAASGLDWCCVRPTGLTDGPSTGGVRLVDRFAFNAWITRADVAAYVLDCVTAPTVTNRTPIISGPASQRR
ncbi:MAG TPA: NAD(P)H-binding protein [Phycicoccus elongatus]|nr:NAD(P)H-binding protein [Phycicoccus elongatus]